MILPLTTVKWAIVHVTIYNGKKHKANKVGEIELDQGYYFWIYVKIWNMIHMSVHPPSVFLECTLMWSPKWPKVDVMKCFKGY